ncbi:hypothetical protein ACFL5Z_09540 [Planctomycetota bacterium]
MTSVTRKITETFKREKRTEGVCKRSTQNAPLAWGQSNLTGNKKPCHGQYDCMRTGSTRVLLASLIKKWTPLKNIPIHTGRYLKTIGLIGTTKHALLRVASLIGIKKKVRPISVPKCEEVLNLQVGELVEVKSIDEIRKTLDQDDRFRGLYFMGEMRRFCERRFRVHKKVNRILLESTEEIRNVKNTVLLEGVMCDGHVQCGCDRSCFYYWREAWLKRVEE